MASALSAETILKDLGAMWRSFGEGENGEAVLRACSMTLIVVAQAGEDTAAVSRTLAPAIQEHPGRTILVSQEEGGTALEAEVSAQCWMAFGRRQHVCSEQIRIAAGRETLTSLAPVLRALVAPDLPAVLWARDAGFAFQASSAEMLDLAGKVIVDTSYLPDPPAALAQMAALSRRRKVADLAWARITRWRETVARACETRGCLERLASFRELAITHGRNSPSTETYYLAAWMAGALGWEIGGIAERLRLVASAETETAVMGVELRGEGFEISLRPGEGKCVELHAGTADNRALLPGRMEHELVSEELGMLEKDLIFEDTLKRAAKIAAP